VFATDFMGIRTKTIEAVTGVIEWLSKLGTKAYNHVTGFVSDVRDRFSDLASTALEKGRQFVGNLVAAITNRVRRVRDAAGRIKDRITGEITALVDSAKDWGESVIQGIIDGFQAKIQALKDAAAGVARAIRDRLPSSPAKKGPLSDLDKVGPGMVETVASGVERNQGRAASAANRFAGSMAGGM